ncbi:lamin tail domain-containing protein [bacterium]|nr:lamin tail domain-containing protein [bacterium]
MRFKTLLWAGLVAIMCLPAVQAQLIINEVDADQTETDSDEFIELYDGGTGSTSLDGYVVVLFNGSDDASYSAFDLDGMTTDANGYFVLGSATVPNVGMIIGTTNAIQNGADAVALYTGDDADFPEDTPVTTTNLIDAIVYDTNDDDDAGLLILLNASEPQINEDMSGQKDIQSIGRCPNGTGGARNTNTYLADAPSPGADNPCTAPTPAPTNTPGGTQTIADIQGTGETSPYVGQTLTVTGICYAMQDGRYNAFIADAAGPWNGILLYNSSGWTEFAIGDEIEVIGVIGEYNGVTQVASITSVTVLSSGNTPYAPTVLTTLAGYDEQYESTYVRFENVTVTDPDPGYSEWEIDDSSGAILVDNIYIYTYIPVLNDVFDWIQGPLNYSYLNYKVAPCGDSDMQIYSSGPSPTPGPTETPIPATPVTIYDVQFTTDPSGDSPYNGDLVEFTAVISAFEEGKTKMWVQDGTGSWNGVVIYESYPGHTGYNVGDAVTVYGTVDEYNNLTEITDATITVTGTGTVPVPVVLTTLAANDEQYEGVFIEVQNVTVTSVNSPAWDVDDGSGALEAWSYFNSITYSPVIGDTHSFVRGIGDYYSGKYEILPRTNADIGGYVPPQLPTTSHLGLILMLLVLGSLICVTVKPLS